MDKKCLVLDQILNDFGQLENLPLRKLYKVLDQEKIKPNKK